jgi:hypothetical protein
MAAHVRKICLTVPLCQLEQFESRSVSRQVESRRILVIINLSVPICYSRRLKGVFGLVHGLPHFRNVTFGYEYCLGNGTSSACTTVATVRGILAFLVHHHPPLVQPNPRRLTMKFRTRNVYFPITAQTCKGGCVTSTLGCITGVPAFTSMNGKNPYLSALAKLTLRCQYEHARPC